MEWMKQQICFKTFSETFFLPAWMLKRTTCLTSQTSLSHISMWPSFEAGHKYTFLLLRGHLLITNNKSLGCEREHKHPEKTHASMRRACRLCWIQTQPFMLQGNRSHCCTTTLSRRSAAIYSPSTRLLPKCTLENITNLLMYRFVISTKQGCVPNYPGVIHKRFIIEWWWAWWEDSDLRTGGQRLWNRRRGVSELQWQINGNSPVESFSGLHVCRRRDTGGGEAWSMGNLESL